MFCGEGNYGLAGTVILVMCPATLLSAQPGGQTPSPLRHNSGLAASKIVLPSVGIKADESNRAAARIGNGSDVAHAVAVNAYDTDRLNAFGARRVVSVGHEPVPTSLKQFDLSNEADDWQGERASDNGFL